MTCSRWYSRCSRGRSKRWRGGFAGEKTRCSQSTNARSQVARRLTVPQHLWSATVSWSTHTQNSNHHLTTTRYRHRQTWTVRRCKTVHQTWSRRWKRKGKTVRRKERRLPFWPVTTSIMRPTVSTRKNAVGRAVKVSEGEREDEWLRWDGFEYKFEILVIGSRLQLFDG